MKKVLLILLTIILMISVSACSSRAGNGNAAQSQNEEKTTETPDMKKTEGTKSDEGKQKKTIVFSTYFPDDFFKEAKKKYEAKHPNITIELKYVEGDGEAANEKFVKTTNTAMLSGKGPDLIEMQSFPLGQYVDKKLLANISEMIDKDPTFKKEQYFNNILEGVKLNGGIYAMPLRFVLYGFIGNETVIEKSGLKIDDKNWNWNQFTDVAKELMKYGDEKQKSALFGSPDNLLNEMVQDQFSTFVDKVSGEAQFDSDTFTKLLKQVKSLFDEQVATEKPEPTFFRSDFFMSPSGYINALKQSEFLLKGYEYKSKLYSKPNAEGQKAGGYFRPYKSIGINEKSTVKEEAWDFLKFMMSDEMETGGFSINKKSYEKSVQRLLKEGNVKSEQEMGPMKGKVFEITKKDIQELEGFISEAIYPVEFRPTKVEEIISTESKAYFSGQKSAEEVAKLIQNRVTTFLNE